jgi:exopolyphosphatase
MLTIWQSAIAIDSDGLNPEKSSKEDRKTAERLLKRSNWHDKDLDDVMDDLDSEIGDARKELDHLSLRDLLRRDWKGDLVDTPSTRTPTVSLGFASVPIAFEEQIERTEWKELFGWFATHAAWTAQTGADVSVTVGKYKVKVDSDGVGMLKKKKIREIVLVVRDDVRVDDEQADELFQVVYEAIGSDKNLNAKPWHRVDELGKRQMVWTHEYENGGRKYVRPLVEKAIKSWR